MHLQNWPSHPKGGEWSWGGAECCGEINGIEPLGITGKILISKS